MSDEHFENVSCKKCGRWASACICDAEIATEHAAIAASYEAQRAILNGSGLPYGLCQCAICAKSRVTKEPLCHQTQP